MTALATGVLKGPHGIQGFIKLHSYSQEYAHLENLDEVFLRKGGNEQTVHIEQIKPNGKEVLIKFVGINTPESARKLNGWEIWIPREAAISCESGEYYVADLASCALCIDHEVVATVVGVIEGPQALLLEVLASRDQKRYLVPFLSEYIGTVDTDRKEMELLVPELLS
jgi:16S rRNA processing protein RimM